jgi:sarcosine oxidase, subunit gamma
VADSHHLGTGSTAPGHHGPAPAGVTLAETKLAGAWNVQGDAAQPRFGEVVRRLFGIALPAAPNTSVAIDALTALWLGPTSWLLVGREASTLTDFSVSRDALNAAGGALFELGASRIAWTISGAHAATVLSKSCPLDFHPRVFAKGACAQSVFGHVNALFYKRDTTPVFTLMVARSFARDVWGALCASAAQYGYDVLPPRDF